MVEFTYQEAHEAYTTSFIANVSFLGEETAKVFYEENHNKNLPYYLLAFARNAYYDPIKKCGVIKRISKVERECFDVVFIRAWKEAMESISEGDVA